MRCPRCDLEMENGRCDVCGYNDPKISSTPDTTVSSKDVVKHVATTAAVLTFLGLLFLNTALTILSVEMVLPETLTGSGVIFIVFPIPIGIIELSGYSFSAYYLFLVAAILVSLVVIFYKGLEDLYLSLKEVFTGKFKEVKENDRLGSPILRLVSIFTALLFITMIYYLGLEMMGLSPSVSPIEDYDLWERLYSLTQAVVWEEIVVRVVFIGIPMAVYAAGKGKEKLSRYVLGGFGFEYRVAVVWILISSVIFALAHLPAWDLLKMFPTFIAGLAFGYLFVKNGLYSAILLHFFWNFMSVPDMMTDMDNYLAFLSWLTVFWMIVGAYYTYHYTKKVATWVQKKPRKKAEPIRKKPVERAAGVSVGYVCQGCGFDKALYTGEGKVKCKRCGNESEAKTDRPPGYDDKLSRNREWPPS